MGDQAAIPVLKPGIEIALPGQPQPEIDAAVQKLYADCLPKTVQISTDRGSGSGFFMDKDGTIGSAAHVVLGSREQFATTSDGTRYKLRIEKLDDVNDTAILRPVEFTPGSRPYAELGSGTALLPGQMIYPIGHPGGLRPAYISPGIVNFLGSQREVYTNKKPDAEKELDGLLDKLPANEVADANAALARDFIGAKVQIRPGNSGGPVFDAAGNVVGLSDFCLQSKKLDSGYFVPVEKIRDLYNNDNSKFQFTYNWIASPWVQDYKNTWAQKPLIAGGETTLAAGLGYVGYRALAAFPKTLGSSAAAIAGLGLLADAGSLLSSTDSRDKFKFAAASAADLTGVASGLALLSSRCRVGGAIGLSVAVAGRLAAEFIPTHLVLTDMEQKANLLAPPMNPEMRQLLGVYERKK